MRSPEKTIVHEAGVAKREMVKTLKRSVVFQDLAPSELAEFASRIESPFLSQGLVHLQGRGSGGLHPHRPRRPRAGPKGTPGRARSSIFAILAQGEIIATPGPSEKRLRVSSEAVTDMVLFRVPKEEFLEYVAGRPQGGHRDVRPFSQRGSTGNAIGASTPPERGGRDQTGALSPHSGEQVRHQAFPHAQGACRLCGDNHRTTIRMLGKLKEKGLILHSPNPGEIVIADLAVLRRYAKAPVLRKDR